MKFIFIFFNLIFISNSIFAQPSNEAIVPPIQFPEQKIEETVQKSELEKGISNAEKIKEINLENQMQMILSNKTPENDAMKNLKTELETKKSKSSEKIKTKESDYDFLKEDTPKNKSGSDLLKFFTLAICFISIIAVCGYFLVKMKKRGSFALTRPDKIMDVVSSLSISPKRQVLILRIRDQEIVVSNTEAGINFLTEISGNSGYQSKQITEKKPNLISDKMTFSKSDRSFVEKPELRKEIVTNNSDKVAEKKSDILLKALKSLNANSLTQKLKNSEEKNGEKIGDENKPGNFPKYLANQFEAESKKDLKKKEEDGDSVENVTNLIREKLRSMKPLN
ncbi:flagellar biosynthetic protein FliO [Fluviispira vulneris]|uniref:flagellar biosynthetic protein FliO n=1 Tax=Fluviispira vulneris TaxID=2763012 RepID=UPI001644165F|nr:flagellar biosynthetic protein FliO [Fluviispira vulneris]